MELMAKCLEIWPVFLMQESVWSPRLSTKFTSSVILCFQIKFLTKQRTDSPVQQVANISPIN